MSGLALGFCLVTFNVVLAGVAWLACRVSDAVKQLESAKDERRPVDMEFASIVSTSLADLQERYRGPR